MNQIAGPPEDDDQARGHDDSSLKKDEERDADDDAEISGYLDAVHEYETSLDRGTPLDPVEVIRRYSQYAQRLRDYFDHRRRAQEALDGPIKGQPEFVRIEDFDHYRVIDLVGWGGNAAIFQVEDERFGRPAAIKVPLKTLARTPSILRRMRREARLSGKLQHPNIVPVYDVGLVRTSEGELPYFAMRLIEGAALSRLLEARSSPLEDQFQYIQYFQQICQAIAYAHGVGIIHRDLKPGNVMIGRFRDAYVMDWGYAAELGEVQVRVTGGNRSPADLATYFSSTVSDAAKTVSMPSDHPERAGGTAEGEASAGRAQDEESRDDWECHLGTPQYLPPEIAVHRAGVADRRSDVFCLGGTLCSILTGTPPFDCPDAGTAFLMSYGGDLARARERLDACGAAPELVQLAKTCLSRDPADRPASAQEVADAVADYINRQELAKLEAERKSAMDATAKAEAETRLRINAERLTLAERRSKRLSIILLTCLLVMVAAAGAAGGR